VHLTSKFSLCSRAKHTRGSQLRLHTSKPHDKHAHAISARMPHKQSMQAKRQSSDAYARVACMRSHGDAEITARTPERRRGGSGKLAKPAAHERYDARTARQRALTSAAGPV